MAIFDFKMLSALQQLCEVERTRTVLPTDRETETWSELLAHVQQK